MLQMEIRLRKKFVWLLLIFLFHIGRAAFIRSDLKVLSITRQNIGDVFSVESDNICNVDTCIGVSSGTATSISLPGSQNCNCQCLPHLPVFREDLQICVDDIHECILSPFVSGSTSQQIPFVFLPLKGQIIHPSKEINFTGIQTPVCAVSGAKFLTDSTWIDLRNPIDADVPFRLFRDEGRTFLQWMGDPELRSRMAGRLVLIHLMCREIKVLPEKPSVFSPCVAFRVVGSPKKYLSNVTEVLFISDENKLNTSGSGLSMNEYVAIGVCSVLLGLIYVASVFLYLQLKKKRRQTGTLERCDSQLEEGVVKSNPLLNLNTHFGLNDNNFSDSGGSENEITPDILHNDEGTKRTFQKQITSAVIHPLNEPFYTKSDFYQNHAVYQETIERLPEENVSIVEISEVRDDKNDNINAVGFARRKLYFNPAYFEPHLLRSPPPAAVEFLIKIREVIAIAKQKMASKQFTPVLNGIPEEEILVQDAQPDVSKPFSSRRSSLISLKRENSRRKSCSGCPGCEPQDCKVISGSLPEISECEHCSSPTNIKQLSIQKWLDNIPDTRHVKNEKHIRGIASRSLSPDYYKTIQEFDVGKDGVQKASSESGRQERRIILGITSSRGDNDSYSVQSTCSSSALRRGKKNKKAPPPPIQAEQNIYDVILEKRAERKSGVMHTLKSQKMQLPPPDMIHEAMVIDKNKTPVNNLKNAIDYETDSLERYNNKIRNIEYADIIPSQSSPTLSSALPMEEEMTMRNAIINTNTGEMTISKLKGNTQAEEQEYEVIVINKIKDDNNMFQLPELLQKGNGYNLVSEVYVNNGYNYGSAPSTPSGSNCSTLERKTKIVYEKDQPGHLLIQVEDCQDNYIKNEDSDDFEPDTLDRKPSKLKIFRSDYLDSLERPNKILLRTTGSFKKDCDTISVNENMLSSLREIYENKCKEEGRILTLEERHCKRQRKNLNDVPPDVIPPDPLNLYEQPKPPRKVNELNKVNLLEKFLSVGDLKQQSISTKKPNSKNEDSGYLSTDSSDSRLKKKLIKETANVGSDTDESLGDAQSESGAESIETHSVFFGSFRNEKHIKKINNKT